MIYYSFWYDHYFKSYDYLNINDIEIMMIKLCPLYWTQGLKATWKVSNIMDARTEKDIMRFISSFFF